MKNEIWKIRFGGPIEIGLPLSPVHLFPLLLILFLPACGKAPPGRGAGEVELTASSTKQGSVNFRVETVVGNVEVPWSIVWTPDGRMLFTERVGRVRVYEHGKLR